MFRAAIATVVIAGCAQPADDARDAFVITTLAEDNHMWARREPDILALKLAKMQRDPFLWLRGTLSVYWRDATTPGDRPATAFGDVASSHVLLVGDPHPENVGSYRTAAGAMVIEFNDFDAAGYGPYGLDVRRLAIGMIIASGATGDTATEIARDVALGYAAQIDLLAHGAPVVAIGAGVEPILDDVIAKAQRNGDRGEPLDEIAPVVDGERAIAFGDLEPVAADGVIENRQLPVGAEAATWIASAVGRVALQCRRIGSGLASYPALRYYAILDDDTLLELKESREGVLLDRVPQYAASEWSSPAARVVDAQRRLHAQPDSDPHLASAEVGGLSLRIKDRAAYQRGMNADDIADLPVAEQRSLARTLGGLLARGHGNALTADGDRGVTVIAPRIAGFADAFADEIARDANADTARLVADWERMKDRDLAAEIAPRSPE